MKITRKENLDKIVTVRFSEKEFKKIKRIANQNNRSVSETIRILANLKEN